MFDEGVGAHVFERSWVCEDGFVEVVAEEGEAELESCVEHGV